MTRKAPPTHQASQLHAGRTTSATGDLKHRFDAAHSEHTASQDDWGYQPMRSGMAGEVKLALMLILTLVSAFGFVAYRKLNDIRKHVAAGEATTAAEFGELDLSANAPPQESTPSAPTLQLSQSEPEPTLDDAYRDVPFRELPHARHITESIDTPTYHTESTLIETERVTPREPLVNRSVGSTLLDNGGSGFAADTPNTTEEGASINSLLTLSPIPDQQSEPRTQAEPLVPQFEPLDEFSSKTPVSVAPEPQRHELGGLSRESDTHLDLFAEPASAGVEARENSSTATVVTPRTESTVTNIVPQDEHSSDRPVNLFELTPERIVAKPSNAFPAPQERRVAEADLFAPATVAPLEEPSATPPSSRAIEDNLFGDSRPPLQSDESTGFDPTPAQSPDTLANSNPAAPKYDDDLFGTPTPPVSSSQGSLFDEPTVDNGSTTVDFPSPKPDERPTVAAGDSRASSEEFFPPQPLGELPPLVETEPMPTPDINRAISPKPASIGHSRTFDTFPDDAPLEDNPNVEHESTSIPLTNSRPSIDSPSFAEPTRSPEPTPFMEPAPLPRVTRPMAIAPSPAADFDNRQPLPGEPRSLFDQAPPAHIQATASVAPFSREVGQDRVHDVQPGDNYWKISRQHYGTIRYFGALHEYNRDRIATPEKMRPGMKVLIPDATVLEERYPQMFRGMEPVGTPQSPRADAVPGFYVSAEGEPMYRVGKGDTLTSIAQKCLGRSSRWVQIQGLNESILKTPDSLKLGMELRLPRDASQVELTPQ
ncbi:MAG: LysM peptidoglycan-binding domain-containing protein [Planctomycetaceae bacterium]